MLSFELINDLGVSFAEPVGAKAPTFSLEYKLIEVQKSKGTAFALLCQAQAFPVPIIR